MNEIEVHKAGARVGTAYFTRRHSRVSSTFAYDPAYIAGGGSALEPALPLDLGTHFQDSIPRSFGDSAPDRWGRNLLTKAERTRAREANSRARTLDEVDFLLGVSDLTRQGALRFFDPRAREFLGAGAHVPRLFALPELLGAADSIAHDEDPRPALKTLLDTGTTGLGGARPKASVVLADGTLGIAKFPHPSDDWDVMAWEATALDLLAKAGVRTSKHQLTRVGERSVLLLERFDREGAERIGYMSALTALGVQDGDRLDYAEVGDAVRALAASPQAELEELFARVVVSVGLGNTDDHLRNHGFLETRGGWVLSPTFDVNPNPDLGKVRATSIMGADALEDEAGALLPLAEELGLSPARARGIVARVRAALGFWEGVARANGIANVSVMRESITARLGALGGVV